MSTHNIGFYEDFTKIIFELSSNMHLISSAAFCSKNESKAGVELRLLAFQSPTPSSIRQPIFFHLLAFYFH